MAQTWTATKAHQAPRVQGLPTGTFPNPSGQTILSCTGPATSVSDGAVVSITSDLASKIIGAKIIARKAGSAFATYSHEVKVSTGFSTENLKIVTYRRSTGALLSAAVSLTGETLYLETIEVPD